MQQRMKDALGQLGAMVNMYFPAALKKVLLDQAAEIDRLRREVDELRSQK